MFSGTFETHGSIGIGSPPDGQLTHRTAQFLKLCSTALTLIGKTVGASPFLATLYGSNGIDVLLGELEIKDGRRIRKGFVGFSSKLRHRVCPVLSGVRYSALVYDLGDYS